MADITTRYSTAGQFRPKVYTRQRWIDPWVHQPYLYPLQSTRNAGPEVGTATLEYRFGPHEKRHDQATTQSYAPLDISRYYVRIDVEDVYNPGVVERIWWGTIEEESTELHSHTSLAGVQRFTAYELSHLLRRYTFASTKWIADTFHIPDVANLHDLGTGETVTRDSLNWGYTHEPRSFNYYTRRGNAPITDNNQLMGNMAWSYVLKDVDDDGQPETVQDKPYFGDYHKAMKVWTIPHMMQYIMESHWSFDPPEYRNSYRGWLPSLDRLFRVNAENESEDADAGYLNGPFVKLKWMSDALESALHFQSPVIQVTDRTMHQVISDILARRNGLVWWVDVRKADFTVTDDDTDDDAYYIWICVDSIFGEAFTVGDASIPANTNQVPFAIAATTPDTHWTTLPRFDYKLQDSYDVIVVQSQPIRVTATFSSQDNTFLAGWTTALENEYNTGGAGTTAEEKDEYRASDKFNDVYSKQIVPYNWDWKVSTGSMGGDATMRYDVLPVLDGTTGSVIWNDALTVFPRENRISDGGPMHQRVFERLTCLVEGSDYSVTPVTHGANMTEYRPLIAVIKNRDGRWVYLDKMNTVVAEAWLLPGANVTPLDNQMGVQIGVNPNHVLGRNDFTGAGTEVTNFSAADYGLDWGDVAVTATFHLPIRQELRILPDTASPRSQEDTRILFVTMPRCEHWWLAPETVVDVSDTGTLKLAPATGTVLRDDNVNLKIAAAQIKEWFTAERQAIAITSQGISATTGITAPIGAYVTDITGAVLRKPVNCYVTSQSINYEAGTTLTTTDFMTFNEFVERLTS